MDLALANDYLVRLWDPSSGFFNYKLEGGRDVGSTRGMVPPGILALSLGGEHKTQWR